MEKWYLQLVNAIFESISVHAQEHPKTPSQVVRMDNYHHMYSLLAQLKVPVLDALKKEAKTRYNVALKAYVIQNFGRPLEKLNVLDGKTSRKMLSVAKKQQLELTEENFPSLAPKRAINFNLGDINEDDDKVDVTEDNILNDLQIGEEDAKEFERFQNPEGGKRTVTLSEIIIQKIQEKQADIQTKLTDDGSLKIEDIDPRSI